MRRKQNKFLVRLIAIILSILTVLGTVMAVLPSRARALTSLNQIETIKNNQAVFTILEIVPQEDAGSIGYYAVGQEPVISEWEDLAAAFVPTRDQLTAALGSSSQARINYVRSLFQELIDRGLMGVQSENSTVDMVATYPMTLLEQYNEWMPWATDIPANAKLMTLNQSETAQGTGSFTSVPMGQGEYVATTVGTLDPVNATHVQNVLYYEYVTQADLEANPGKYEDAFYYRLTFAPVTISNYEQLESYRNVPLYRKASGNEFVYEGTYMGENTFQPYIDVEYWQVTGYTVGNAYEAEPTAPPQGASVDQTVAPGANTGTEGGNENGTEGGNENGTEGGNENGTEGGNENGTETGNENGTETGNENGAEGGNENGAEGGNENGAEGGNENGTEGGNENGAEGGNENGTEGGNESSTEGGNENGTETGNETTQTDNTNQENNQQENTEQGESQQEENTQTASLEEPTQPSDPTAETEAPSNASEVPDVTVAADASEATTAPTEGEVEEEEKQDWTFFGINFAALDEIEASLQPMAEGDITTAGMTYVPVCDPNVPFTTDKESWENYQFTIRIDNYAYKGPNQGNYTLDPSGTGTVTVSYNQVYYVGSYENNDWLLRHVFDMEYNDDGTPKKNLSINVISLTPSQADGITQQITAANMVVLTAPKEFESGAYTNSIAYDGDISDDQEAAIIQRVTDNFLPLLVDSRLVGDTYAAQPNLQGFATASLGGLAASANGVMTSVYRWEGVNTVQNDLATNAFKEKFTNTANYTQVLKEITYENFLRENQGMTESELLPEIVSMATAIRSIINYQGVRVENHKSSIKVLDIEPSGYPGANKGGLTKTKVRRWTGNALTENQIEIETMSSLEFVGSIEDITEEYDLIYIGANIAGYKTVNDNGIDIRYNDSTMNGLIYTNIGDTFTSNYMLTGLLDRDYTTRNNRTVVNDQNGSKAATFRFSGNDITEKKQLELEDFAKAGLPVILADALVSGNAASEERELAVEISGDIDGNDLMTLESVVTGAQGATLTYQWYRGGQLISGATSSTYSASEYNWRNNPYGYEEGTSYHLVVTAYVNTGSTSSPPNATSNTLTVMETAGEVGTLTPGTASTTQNGSALIEINYSIVDGQPLSLSAVLPGEWNPENATFDWYFYQLVNNEELYYQMYISTQNATSPYGGSFICKVDYDGKTYWSELITIQGYDGIKGTTNRTTPNPNTGGTLTVTPTQGRDGVSAKLTATVEIPAGWTVVNYNWKYYYAENTLLQGADASVFDLNNRNPGEYWCQVDLKDAAGEMVYLTSSRFTYSVATKLTLQQTDTGTTGTIPALEATTLALNTNRIDVNSLLYKALNNIFSRRNVMPEWMAEDQENQNTVLRYLNLSKPIITFAQESTAIPYAKPGEYTGIADLGGKDANGKDLVPQSDGQHYLPFVFQIDNPTDATPATTQYRVRLFIDQNADGRHSDEEEISSDLNIYDSSGNWVDNGKLYGSTDSVTHMYSVRRYIDSSVFSGAVCWKLVVEKVEYDDNGNVVESLSHTSEKGYSYIKPDANKKVNINVLQLYSFEGSRDWYGNIDYDMILDSEWGDTTYRNLYTQVSDVYNITVHSEDVSILEQWVNKDKNDPQGSVYEELDKYNMLILGFGDAYARNKDIPEAAARAISQYIDSGKAVLFTHDNTSISNLPEANYPTYNWSYINDNGTNSGDYWWGFNFNNIIRDKVGLDRYGVTNTVYGGNRYNGLRKDGNSGIVASSAYLTASPEQKQELIDADYTVAYQPKVSGRTVGETQGFTNFALTRYGTNGSENAPAGYARIGVAKATRDTTKVTRTNQGQITQFPFVIGDPNNDWSLSIKATHDQYYQLNMNSDDIVVWYCLGGDNYRNTKNDVVNGYYIYNKGNVTYTGSGHVTSGATAGEMPDTEAQLFVNTMIAAYRAGNSDPTADFKTPNGKQSMPSQMIPVAQSTSTDENGVVTTALDEHIYAYFMVEDTNLTANKFVGVEFYVENPNGAPDEELVTEGITDKVSRFYPKVSRGDNKAPVDASTSFVSNLLYRIELPYVDDPEGRNVPVLKTLFDQQNDNDLMIYIKVRTILNGETQQPYIGVASQKLMKMGLLSLH